MERSIQTGDYVTLSREEESQLYSIERVGPSEIIIALVSDATQKKILVPKNGKWSVGGTTLRYDIEFKSKEDLPQLLFTKVSGVNIQILNELDDKTLNLVCQIDRYAASLCRTDDLWIKRLEKYFGDKVSLMEAPSAITIFQFRDDLSGSYFAYTPEGGGVIVAVFDGKTFVPLNAGQQELIRALGYPYNSEILPRITDYMKLVAEKLPKRTTDITYIPVGPDELGLYLMTKPPTGFIMAESVDTVIAFFNGEDLAPLIPEQIRRVERMGMKYVPGRIPSIPEGSIPFHLGQYSTETILETRSLKTLYKNLDETWRAYYQRASKIFHSIYIVVWGDINSLGEGMQIEGIYTTKEEAADAIISAVENEFEMVDGVPKFDLGSYGEYVPQYSGGLVNFGELKEYLTAYEFALEASDGTYYSIISTDQRPICELSADL